MWSLGSSAFVPSSVTTRPLTVTRPDRIISSARRREANPTRAIIFCRRSSIGVDLQHSGNGADGDGRSTALRLLAMTQLPEVVKVGTGAGIDWQIARIGGRFSSEIDDCLVPIGFSQREDEIRFGSGTDVVGNQRA